MVDDGFEESLVAFRTDIVESSGEYREPVRPARGVPTRSMAWMAPQWAGRIGAQSAS